MAAELCSENTTESVRSGFLDLGVQQIWQVITANRTVNADVVLSDPGLPAIGSGQVFSGETLYVINRTATRQDTDKTGRKWFVNVQWSNNTGNFARDVNGQPVQDPTLTVKDVVVTYHEYTEPINNAVFENVTQGGPYGVGTAADAPFYLNDLTPRPVTISSGEAIEVQGVKYREIITVTRTERNWNATYDDFTNTMNDAELVITESDSEGVRATYTYPKWTLRMKPITKEKIWQNEKMYYRVTFEMEYNQNTWIHSELDASQKRRVWALTGSNPYPQKKVGGGTYTQDEVDKIAGEDTGTGVINYIQSIMTYDQDGNPDAAIGDPVPLNGYGAEQPTDRADSNVYTADVDLFYINYRLNTEKDWSVLNL